ncbi:MAG TPA: hypothetical protein VK828_02585 [Terriglobales bacterium]|jgi:hypothetical protein|nr:hypothetical protein [Terriglobales bacterium]
MDWQIEDEKSETDTRLGSTELATKSGATRLSRSDHLMCEMALWGVAGFLGCAYFAWTSLAHVVRGDYGWPHDYWTAATYIVWIVLLAFLALDTRCLRERVFFGVLVGNFLVGFAVTLWRGIPVSDVRLARIVTGALWALAALVSLTTMRGVSDKRANRGSN